MTTNISTKLRNVTAVIALTCFLTGAVAQVKNEEKSEGKQKDEDNRNVMLNAANANGPREIQIGLPMSDVNVLENGLPITYATNPRSVNSIWRSDASLEHVGLLKISETAITTGNIGYAVNSFTKLGQKEFHGQLDYKTNHFGLNEYSLNLNGSLGQGWYYSANMYQDFDPGTFDIKSSQYQDRTQIYKGALTKVYDNGRGKFTAIYRNSRSHPVYTFATQSAPFIYVGDGSVQEYGQFRLGTTSYLPVDPNMTYMDMRTGEIKETSLYDASKNTSSEVFLSNDYHWDNGLTWRLAARYDHAHGALVYQKLNLFTLAKLLWIKHRAKRYIILYLGIDPQYLGLGSALSYPIFKQAQARGASAVGALIHQHTLTRHYAADLQGTSHTYGLYQLLL